MANKKLKDNVLFLGLASLLNDAATDMINPLLPLFLSSVIGAPGVVIGLIEGAAKASEQIGSFLFGWYSDKIGKRKPLIAAGYLLPTVMKGMLAFTTSWPQFFVIRSLERSGKAIRTPPRDALLAESVSKTTRRSGFALHRMLDTLGAIIGPLIGAFLIGYLATDFSQASRIIFLAAVVPGVLSVLVVRRFVVEPKRKVGLAKRPQLKEVVKIERFGTDFAALVKTFALLTLFAPAVAFFYLKASAIGMTTADILLLATAYSVAYFIGAGFLSLLSRVVRVGRKAGMVFGLMAMAAIFFAMSKTADLAQFSALFAAYGFVTGLMEVEVKTYTSLLVDKRKLASAYGTYQTIIGLAALGGGLIVGLLWDVSQAYAFQAAGTASLISLGVFLGRKEKKESTTL